MAVLELDTPVQYVKGVGPRRAEQLGELGLRTVADLLTYFPRRFDLRRQVQPIETVRGHENAASVAGEVIEAGYRPRGHRPYFECSLDDGTGWLTVKWFHGGYLRDRIKPGMHLVVSGKPSVYRECIQFVNPRWQVIWSPEGTDLASDELLPVYPTAGPIPSALIAKIVANVLPEAPRLIGRWFDAEHLRSRELIDRPAAIVAMHKPEDRKAYASGRRRIAYDEFLLMQLGIALQRMKCVSRPAWPLAVSDQIDRRIRLFQRGRLR